MLISGQTSNTGGRVMTTSMLSIFISRETRHGYERRHWTLPWVCSAHTGFLPPVGQTLSWHIWEKGNGGQMIWKVGQAIHPILNLINLWMMLQSFSSGPLAKLVMLLTNNCWTLPCCVWKLVSDRSKGVVYLEPRGHPVLSQVEMSLP